MPPFTGPPTQAQGRKGTLRIGGIRAGVLTEWRVVISPSTKQYTLFGKGTIARYYIPAVGGAVRVELTPTPVPRRIGRPAPKAPAPFVLAGTIAELTGTTITISQGEIARD